MKHPDYLKRLTLHGGRLVGRVFMILVSVVGYSLWEAFGRASSGTAEDAHEEEEHGVYPTGVPWDTNYTHTDWELHYGDPRK